MRMLADCGFSSFFPPFFSLPRRGGLIGPGDLFSFPPFSPGHLVTDRVGGPRFPSPLSNGSAFPPFSPFFSPLSFF